MTEPLLDLTLCDRELIHNPGAIQPHGILFALSAAHLRVQAVSANASLYCGADAHSLLNIPLSQVLTAASFKAVAEAESLATGGHTRLARLRLLGNPDLSWRGIVHVDGDVVLLEAELVRPGADIAVLDHFEHFQVASQRLMTSSDVAVSHRRLAEEVRRLTGYSRVIIYRFDADWSGEVIAEDSDGRMPRFLGLHFPASDIPVQARALYSVTAERQIPDVDYAPVPLLQAVGAPIDLTHAALRSVSVSHIAYLRNMRASASMSISLLRNGRLWGLITLHHPVAHIVSPEVRQSCVLLSQMAMAHLSLIEETGAARHSVLVKAVEATLLRETAEGDENYDSSLHENLLRRNSRALLELLGASGMILRAGDTTTLLGETPQGAALDRALAWIAAYKPAQSAPGLLATEHFASHYRDAAYLPEAAGILAVPLGGADENVVIWLRPEIGQSVVWAGEPNKPLDAASGQDGLLPRRSFDAWTEEVRGHSRPWTKDDIAAATSLRDTLAGILVRRSAVIHQRVNALLLRSNQELESFAYIASHDLKEPLRQIEIFGSMLQRAFGRKTDPPEKIERWFSGITTSARRLRSLIDNLASYARLGSNARALAPAGLNVIMSDVLNEFSTQIVAIGATIKVAPLPVVMCDAIQIHQLIQNLISNALKYRHTERPLVLDITVQPSAAPDGSWLGDPSTITLNFQDNGIGFEDRHCERIFNPFERLHGPEAYEGSGLGLAICRKVLDYHEGKITARSRVGEGSVFVVTLPARPCTNLPAVTEVSPA